MNGRNVLNGFFDYVGISEQSHDGAKAIAADARAVSIAKGAFAECAWSRDRNSAISLIADAAAYLSIPTWSEASASELTCRQQGAPYVRRRPSRRVQLLPPRAVMLSRCSRTKSRSGLAAGYQ